jgi:translation initiation factor IF-3
VGFRAPPACLSKESAPGFSNPHRAWGIADLGATRVRFCYSVTEEKQLPPLDNNSKAPRTRVNRQIRISPVRVIADNGDQLGVLTIDEALAAAHERGLDLVEVAPLARPPVVKIMDYGKFKFEQAKAARAAKKKQHVIHLKEVKYRPGIDDHDFDFKTRHAREFLEDGNKVKVTMMYRGRQMAHIELGREVLDRVAQELKDIGKIEQEPKLEGRNMSMVLAPK